VKGTCHILSAARDALRAIGSIWAGVLILALIVLYLSLASLPAGGDRMARLLGTSAGQLYGHGVLLGLLGALCIVMGIATLMRVRLDLPSAGAWAAHLGVILLAAGSLWYAAERQSGHGITTRTASGWTSVAEFYLEGRFGLTAVADDGSAVQAAVGDLTSPDSLRSLDVTLRDPSGAGEIRVRASGPQVRLARAVRLDIADSSGARRVVLSPDLPGRGQYDAGSYLLFYRPDLSPEEIHALLGARGGPAGSDFSCDAGFLLTGPRIAPVLVIVAPDGTRRTTRLAGGAATEVVLGGKRVALSSARFFSVPIIDVRLEGAGWEKATSVPFSEFVVPGTGSRVRLGGGRTIELFLSRFRVALPAAMRIVGAEYQTYPGSVVPKDYVTRVEIVRGEQIEGAVIRLNRPVHLGRYRISQSTWIPEGGRPTEMIFAVASRPGLPVIWTGCLLIVLALPYAFYVKPLLLRRRRAGG